MYTLIIFNYTITYSLTDAGVHLISDAGLHQLMRDYPVKGVRLLAEELKKHFEEEKKRPLKITVKSLVTEIRGHYYFEKLYLPFRWLLRVFFLHKIARILDNSLKAYDCAEAHIDGNRRLWDFLSRFDGLFSFFARDALH